MAAVHRQPRLPVLLAVLACAALAAGCASLESAAPRVADSALWHDVTGITYRTFDAPMARVKPAVVSTLAAMGMRISTIEVHGAREVIRAKSAGSDVEITLERANRAATRVRIAASNGGLLYDKAAAARIVVQTEKRLGSA